MRRPTKADRKNNMRRTHLDLDDGTDGAPTKISHKKKPSSSVGSIICSLMFSFTVLGALYYVPQMIKNSSVSNVARKIESVKSAAQMLPPDSIYRAGMQDLRGDWVPLEKFAGSVSLVVNVACE